MIAWKSKNEDEDKILSKIFNVNGTEKTGEVDLTSLIVGNKYFGQTEQHLSIEIKDANADDLEISGASNLKILDANTDIIDTFKANKDVAWSIEGMDAIRFQINETTGALSFIAAPDFDTPNDAGSDNVYQLTVKATDKTDGTKTQELSLNIQVKNADDPAFEMTGATDFQIFGGEVETLHTFSVNSTTEKEWTLSGIDAGQFQIDDDGNLSFKETPVFKNPTEDGDGDGDNNYQVTVTATGTTFNPYGFDLNDDGNLKEDLVIETLENNQVIIAWGVEFEGSHDEIYAVIYDTETKELVSELSIDDDPTAKKDHLGITKLSNGHFALSWHSEFEDWTNPNTPEGLTQVIKAIGTPSGISLQVHQADGQLLANPLQIDTPRLNDTPFQALTS